MNFNCIVVLGPTASGKTQLACKLAERYHGEIISADSRQVYRSLNLGTGKDLDEYEVNGKKIKYHLIDVADAGRQFFLHEFIRELKRSFLQIRTDNRLPIICGGTGLYLDALRKDFSYTQIEENHALRKKLEGKKKESLLKLLQSYPEEQTKHVDITSTKRIIRGIEVAEFLQTSQINPDDPSLLYKPFYVGLSVPLEELRSRIKVRLRKRWQQGLVQEGEELLKQGITHERLAFLGLEYKYLSMLLQNTINEEEMFEQLETAIFLYAKRQLTWFRKMEGEGVKITWLDVSRSPDTILPLLDEEFKSG